MSISTSLLPTNPFNYLISRNPMAFCGRQKELETIYNYLLSETPNCCAIIGESYFGKTTLLHYLIDPKGASARDDPAIQRLTFVYLDARPYMELAIGDRASVLFWRDLYYALQTRLAPKNSSKQLLSRMSADQNPIDVAFEIKSELEELIHAQKRPIIFALDNFEGIVSLPLRDSAWLRSMTNRESCAYIVTSRYLLPLLYHPESWGYPSPLWNLFSGYVYLGLLQEKEAMELMHQQGRLESFWRKEDIEFIRKTAGRHPELLRMTCAFLYEKRQQTREVLDPEEYDFLESRIYRDVSPICNQLWYGLADPELMGISRGAEYRRDPSKLSMHQKVLMDIAATGDSTEDRQYLFELEERGLIERVNGKWQVFAGIMHQFLLRQEQVRQMAGLTPVYPTANLATPETAYFGDDSSSQQRTSHPTSTQTIPQRAFTYLEGKVYQYLQSHEEQVCDKEEIKQAIWGEDKSPSDSTLQKIIERIRRKIEPYPDNPRYLIAVRGQGYILREG